MTYDEMIAKADQHIANAEDFLATATPAADMGEFRLTLLHVDLANYWVNRAKVSKQ